MPGLRKRQIARKGGGSHEILFNVLKQIARRAHDSMFRLLLRGLCALARENSSAPESQRLLSRIDPRLALGGCDDKGSGSEPKLPI